MSPWGLLSGHVPNLQKLRLQPTCELIVDQYDELTFSTETIGFEPGPMVLGRAFRPSLFDVLQVQKIGEDFVSFTQSSGVAKFRDTLKAMLRNAPKYNSLSAEEIAAELIDFLIDQIGMQVMLERENTKDPVLCTGVFAPILYPLLKKRWPEIKWELCPHSREAEGIAVGSGQNSLRSSP
jgi:hypothetical protein